MLKRFLRSGFVTGVAIGLALTTPSYAARMMHLDDDPPTGGGGGGDDPVLEETPGGGGGGGGPQTGGFGEYIAMRNEMQQAVFGDGTSFSMAYALDAFPSVTGTYIASNSYQMFTVDILTTTPLSAVAAEVLARSDIQAQGVSSIEIMEITAEAIGTGGERFPFSGFAVSWTTATGEHISRLAPVAKNSADARDAQFRPYIQSSPQSIMNGNPDYARLYQGYDDFNCQNATNEQERCICLAQLSFDSCALLAKQTRDSCNRSGLRAVAAALISCPGTALTIWFGFVCVYAVYEAYAALTECDKNYRDTMANCYEGFRIALLGCPIQIRIMDMR